MEEYKTPTLHFSLSHTNVILVTQSLLKYLSEEKQNIMKEICTELVISPGCVSLSISHPFRDSRRSFLCLVHAFQMVWKDFNVHLEHFSSDLFYQHFSLTCFFVSFKVCFTLNSLFVFCTDENHMRFHSSLIIMLIFEEKHLGCSKKMLLLQSFQKPVDDSLGKSEQHHFPSFALYPFFLPKGCKPLLVGGAGSSIVKIL